MVDFIEFVVGLWPLVVSRWSMTIQGLGTTNDLRLATLSCIFERVHHRLFNPYLLKMRFPGPTLQDFVNGDTQVFGSGHSFRKFLHQVQIPMIVALDDMLMYKPVEINQIADHSGLGVHLSANGDLDRVVVPVPVRIVALAINL